MWAVFRDNGGEQVSPICHTWWDALVEANRRGVVVMASGKNFVLAPWYEIREIFGIDP